MIKLLTNWGFTREGWRNGQHGEYLVLLQGVLLLGFVFLPVYRPFELSFSAPTALFLSRAIAIALGFGGCLLLAKGLLDLGSNLTPLPYPKENSQLVQTGAYSIVRHPLYSGLILAALGWAIFQFSLSHLLGAAVFLTFFEIKARREENWLNQKYPDYSDYQHRVKKLIPWLY